MTAAKRQGAASAIAKTPTTNKAEQGAQEEARKASKALEERIPTVVVELQGVDALSKVTLTLDGEPFPRTKVGVRHPIDPGDHTLEGTLERAGEEPIQTRQPFFVNERESVPLPFRFVREPEPDPERRPGAGPGPLPTFVVIGAQKAGTHWMRDNLGAHPDVYVPERELKYFTRPQLVEPRMTKSVSYLTNLLLDNRNEKWGIGPLGHGLHALAMFDERVFGGQPGTRAQELALARKPQDKKPVER